MWSTYNIWAWASSTEAQHAMYGFCIAFMLQASVLCFQILTRALRRAGNLHDNGSDTAADD